MQQSPHKIDQTNNSSSTNILQHINIRIRKWTINNNNQYILFISTINTQTGEQIQCVYRTITQIQNLYRYVIKQYGGHIVPVIDIGKIKQRYTNIEITMDNVQQYLQDLRNNHTCSHDAKYYCFLFQQSMILPYQQSYAKVLTNASNISRKYLNAIFTRKQIPEHKNAQTVQILYEKLSAKFSDFSNIRNIVIDVIDEQRCLEQIKTIMSEISGVPSSSAQPYDDQMTQIQKIIRISDKYIIQTKQAYTRWQILIEGVRQLQNNVFKGLKQDQARHQIRSNQLKNWTTSLCGQFESMAIYFQKILHLLCQFTCNIKCRTIQYTMLISETNNQSLYIEQKKQQKFLSTQQKQKMAVSNNRYLYSQLDLQKLQCFNYCEQKIIKNQNDIIGTETTLEEAEVQFHKKENTLQETPNKFY